MKTILFIDYTIAILLIGIFVGPYLKGFLKEMFIDLKPMRQNINHNTANAYWKNKHTNLCNNCKHHPAICKAIDLDFGNGTRNDNVVKCDYHETKQSLIERLSNKYIVHILIGLAIVIGIIVVVLTYNKC